MSDKKTEQHFSSKKNPKSESHYQLEGRSYNEYLKGSLNSNIKFSFANVQAKLIVSQPGDPYEQEADRVAEKVMSMTTRSKTDSSLLITTDHENKVINRQCSPCEKKKKQLQDQGQKEVSISRKNTVNTTNFAVSEEIANGTENVTANGGKPLDATTKEFMESRFGYDFGKVRIHDYKDAHESAEGVNANAYAIGNHIIFNRDQFSPNTREGNQLLAHELVHVVQNDIDMRRYLPFQFGELGAADYDNDFVISQSCISHGLVNKNVHGEIVFRQQKATSSTKDMTFIELKKKMKNRFGIERIKVGSMQEQISLLSPGRPIPTGITLPEWKEWYPGAESFIYSLIIESLEDFVGAFGGIPEVKDILFFNLEYELDTIGTVKPRPDIPAAFSGSKLLIFRSILVFNKGIPIGRSTQQGKYPPVGGQLVEQGSLPGIGAPMPVPSHEMSVKRIISHELGHGVSEAVSDFRPIPLDKSMLKDYKVMVGWTHNTVKLFDIQVETVRESLRKNEEPPEQFHITVDNWNAPKWNEQPLSKYSVEAGPFEDFAEALMVFIHEPAVLKNRSPARYKFIVERKDKWLSRLLQIYQVGDFPISPIIRRLA